MKAVVLKKVLPLQPLTEYPSIIWCQRQNQIVQTDVKEWPPTAVFFLLLSLIFIYLSFLSRFWVPWDPWLLFYLQITALLGAPVCPHLPHHASHNAKPCSPHPRSKSIISLKYNIIYRKHTKTMEWEIERIQSIYEWRCFPNSFHRCGNCVQII